MKLLTGLIGLIIFAMTLPAASQSSEDVARVVFFDQVVLPSDLTCSISVTQKSSFVRTIEIGNLRFSNGQFVLNSQSSTAAASVARQLINQAQNYCLQNQAQANAMTAAQVANDNALQARVAAENARRAELAKAEAARNQVMANGAQTSNLQATTQFLKDGQQIRNDFKAAQADEAKKNGGTGKPSDRVSADNSGVAAPAGGGATAMSPAAIAATAAAAKGETIPFGDNLSVNTTTRTVNVTLGDDATKTALTYDPTTKSFVSEDRQYSFPPDQLSNAPGCASACADAIKAASRDPKTAGDVAAIKSAATGMDATSQSAAALTKAGGAAFSKTMLGLATQLPPICSAMGQVIVTTAEAYASQLTVCGEKQATADTFCSTIRSPKAMAVQRLMTLGSAVLSRSSSASEGCSAAQKFSTLAQYGMTAANLACTGLKVMCDVSCGSAETSLVTTVTTAIKNQQGLCIAAINSSAAFSAGATLTLQARANAIFGQMTATVAKEKPPTNLTSPAAKLAQCEKYEMDILDMGLQILGTVDAAQQAKACKKALGDGTGGGTDTAQLTMDQFCQVPGQAQNPPCLCRTQPTATGCPGALTATTTTTSGTTTAANGGGVQTTNTGGSAAMAAPGGLSGLQTGTKSGLSADAKAALGISDEAAALAAQQEAATTTASGGVGPGDTSSGGAGGGSMGGLAKSPTDIAKKGEAAKKSGLGVFDDYSLGAGGFAALKFGSDGKATINGKKYTQEEIKKMVERKIASDQFHAEVTTASGKSNWDKVRSRYDDNRSTLFP